MTGERRAFLVSVIVALVGVPACGDRDSDPIGTSTPETPPFIDGGNAGNLARTNDEVVDAGSSQGELSVDAGIEREASADGATLASECLAQGLSPAIADAVQRTADERGVTDPLHVTEILIQTGGMSGIECLSNLESVTLWFEPGMETELLLLAQLPRLVSLTITNVPELDVLSELPQLEALALHQGSDVELSPIADLPRLRTLVLASLTLLSPEPLGEAEDLNELTLYDVHSASATPWDSSFMDGWSLDKLVLIATELQLDLAALNTARLSEMRLFGPQIVGAQLLGEPFQGSGDLFIQVGALDEDSTLLALCDLGWRVWLQPTWCSVVTEAVCPSASND